MKIPPVPNSHVGEWWKRRNARNLKLEMRGSSQSSDGVLGRNYKPARRKQGYSTIAAAKWRQLRGRYIDKSF